jgi:hypothetical protein
MTIFGAGGLRALSDLDQDADATARQARATDAPFGAASCSRRAPGAPFLQRVDIEGDGRGFGHGGSTTGNRQRAVAHRKRHRPTQRLSRRVGKVHRTDERGEWKHGAPCVPATRSYAEADDDDADGGDRAGRLRRRSDPSTRRARHQRPRARAHDTTIAPTVAISTPPTSIVLPQPAARREHQGISATHGSAENNRTASTPSGVFA